MTYAKGSNILASDYNNFTGGQEPTAAFASGALATNKASGLFGVGYGDRGYGQTGISLPAKISGNTILATDWAALRSAIGICASHQGTQITLLPPAASAGQSIVAHEQDAPSSNAYDYQNMLSNIDTNRFNTNSGASMTLTGSALVITRSTTWGQAATPNISAICRYDFGSENAARYFFNSGGELRFVLAHPSTTGLQNSNWNTLLSSIGTIKFAANSTTRTGTIGIQQSIGYYQLTTADQLLIDATNTGTGAYTSNDVLIYGRAVTITGLNGAKGYQIQIRVDLQDQHANVFSDAVDAGTNATFGYLKATSPLNGIISPTLTNIQNF